MISVPNRRHKSIKKPSEMQAKCSKIVKISFVVLQLANIIVQASSAQAFRRQRQQLQQQQQADNVIAEMQVTCHSDAIVLMVNTNKPFNGMLYAKDAPSSSNCVSEYHASTNMTFRLPLKSCGTLSAEVDDGIEYFNTIVVQPHMRLMTNQGKGYHIRCKYQTRERTIANTHFNVSAAFMMQNGPQSSTTPILATASMPMCTMKIYRIDQDDVAESVKVGDKLVMVIEIDRQDMYGMRIGNCVVRDGMNKAEQQLLDEFGCPLDETIMPKFEYEHNGTRAAVAFKAHKFPHTSSVYYQCNVRLCINNGGCDPVNCNQSNQSNQANQAGDHRGPVVDTLAGSGSSTTLASTSGAATNASALNNQGGPRRKRFATGQQQQQQQQQRANLFEAQTINVDEMVDSDAALPSPSELKSTATAAASSKIKQHDQVLAAAAAANSNEVSFDVYSGLYVSDISDLAESNSGDPNGQQVLPSRRNLSLLGAKDDVTLPMSTSSNASGSGTGAADSCLTIGKASFLVIVASIGSVALMLLIACQAGLLGHSTDECNRTLGKRARHSPNGSISESGGDLNYSPSSSLYQQHSQRSASGRQHQYSQQRQHYPAAPINYSAQRIGSGGSGGSGAALKSMSPLRYGLGLMFH